MHRSLLPKMFCSRSILFVLLLVLLNSVYSKKVCDFKNTECITRGAQNVLKTILPGIKGLIEPCDPLHIPDLEGEVKPSLKYKISNSTLSGMSSCQFTNLTMNTEDSSFRSELLCNQLILSHICEAKGSFGPVEVDGIGLLILTLNNYLIKFKGEYEEFTSEIDQKRHFLVKSCHPEFERKGEVTVDFTAPLHSDIAKSDLATAYVRGHPNEVEQAAHSPILENYMKIFVKNIDTYIRTLPADVVLPAII